MVDNVKTAFSEARFKKDEEDLKRLEEERNKELEVQGIEEKSKELEAQGKPEDAQWAKRYGDLRRSTQKMADENKELKKALDDIRSKYDNLEKNSNNSENPDPNADINELRSKYPRLDALIKQSVEQEVEGLKQKVSRIDELEAERSQNKAKETLRKLHPDFYESIDGKPAIEETVEFHDWVEENNFQDVIYKGNDLNQADLIITKYKAAKGLYNTPEKKTKKDTKESVREAAGSVRTTGQPTLPNDGSSKGYDFTESEIAKIPVRELERNPELMEKIEKAQREGRIKYGV